MNVTDEELALVCKAVEPSHFHPACTHLRHSGLVSSHLTRLLLADY
jgi:hypothetical protein